MKQFTCMKCGRAYEKLFDECPLCGGTVFKSEDIIRGE
jgi:rRNA maturation endonuclease Nob1